MERSRGIESLGRGLILGLTLAGEILLAATSAAGDVPIVESDRSSRSGEPILPLPQRMEVNRQRALLGEELFHDQRLSHDGTLACVSCHILGQGGDDGRPLPTVRDGPSVGVNTPTIFNSVLNFRLGWRGTYRRLADQIDADISDPRLMNSSWQEVLGKLRADAGYQARFAQSYEAGITRESVLDALSAFHRSLITPNAPFDQFLRGREDALSAAEKQGYQLFKRLGCASCHQGVNVGGNLFQKVGIFEDYFASRGNIQEIDFGRFNDTGSQDDLFVFRVPSLRNVALTAPYFHDGSVLHLEEAVRKMGELQLGESLTGDEIGLLVQFLHTLTGEYRGDALMPE